MKKLSILAILIGLSLSFSVSAQFKSPKDEKVLTTEQKMLPFAMSMSLSVMGEMHDDQYLSVLTIFQKQISYWSEELKSVVELDKDVADYKRMDVALTATKALRAKSSVSDRWQMLVGEQFGTIYAMIRKNKTEGKEINADDLRFNIEFISGLANKAPNDIPFNVTNKFKEFGKLKDEPNLTSNKNIKILTKEVVNILSAISK
jgi:hypothetical protein